MTTREKFEHTPHQLLALESGMEDIKKVLDGIKMPEANRFQALSPEDQATFFLQADEQIGKVLEALRALQGMTDTVDNPDLANQGPMLPQ